MAESTFLQGRVRKHTLPVLAGPPFGAPPPTLKRLRLAQGELAQVYDEPEGIRYLAVIELLAEAVRGNHFHKVKRESVYVIEGELLLVVVDPDSGARDSFHLEAGDLAFIPTGIAHAMKTIKPGQAIEFAPTRFDPADIFKFQAV